MDYRLWTMDFFLWTMDCGLWTKRGFTLVELFITTGILFLVAIAVYTTFFNGVKVWRRCNVDRRIERNARITLTEMVRDIRNTFEFSNIPFEGTEDSVFSPALINTASSGDAPRYEVGRICYFFDSGTNMLCKEQKTYPYVYNQPEIEESFVIPLVSDVEKLALSYCYLDNATGKYKWKHSWKKEEQETIPQALSMELVCKKNKAERLSYKKTIFIPIGTGEQKIELNK